MARSRFARIKFSGVVLTALLALTACTLGMDPEPTPTAAPETPSPEPYAGPAIFTGDELNALLFTSDEIAALLPGSTEIGEPSSVLAQISDGGGPLPIPEICSVLFVEQSLWSIGSRNVRWTTTADSDYRFGAMMALQFADEAHAQARMDQLVEASSQCANFDFAGAATFESVRPVESDDVRAVAGTVTLPESEGGNSTFLGYAAVGNVLVQVSQSINGEAIPDAEVIAKKLHERAEEARAALTQEFTANPPTPDAEAETDESAPWSEWAISAGGVGLIHLGDPIADAVAAGQAARVIEPAGAGYPWKLVNAEGTGSILVATTDDGSAVASITVGNERIFDEDAQDGAALPLRGGVRVGAPIADAIAAFPGGTTVTVASSGDDWYDVATRDGRLFRFHTDRDVVDPGAVIIGITVEDATKRPLRFS
ncbi:MULTISPECIES: sensor domain-containing protein [unclassified Microbacterium]|uniref:sensor domain-containing protein n=1 Tax=unclassified Microbacterium TaxID=2609290 RepID=UPI0004934B1B|nr:MULTISPECIES: sensor domain-containing protein [unclassified Microbacterium]